MTSGWSIFRGKFHRGQPNHDEDDDRFGSFSRWFRCVNSKFEHVSNVSKFDSIDLHVCQNCVMNRCSTTVMIVIMAFEFFNTFETIFIYIVYYIFFCF